MSVQKLVDLFVGRIWRGFAAIIQSLSTELSTAFVDNLI